MKQKALIIIGLAIGCALNTYRFFSNASLLSKLLGKGSKRLAVRWFMLKYISGQSATIALMVVSLKLNTWLFGGIVSGLLLMTLSIMTLAVAAALGISNGITD